MKTSRVKHLKQNRSSIVGVRVVEVILAVDIVRAAGIVRVFSGASTVGSVACGEGLAVAIGTVAGSAFAVIAGVSGFGFGFENRGLSADAVDPAGVMFLNASPIRVAVTPRRSMMLAGTEQRGPSVN